MPITQHNKINLAQLNEIASAIAQTLSVGDVVAFKGDLGAGKSTFARYLINSLQEIPEEVPSPTFTLVQHFITIKGTICHFDLYRLKKAEEVYELGIEDEFENSITVIEWPDIIENILPKHTIYIELSFSDKGYRDIVIKDNR